MAKRKVTVVALPSKAGGYVAIAPLFPHCTAQGDTIQEALENVQDVINAMLEDHREEDMEALDLAHAPHVVVGEVEVEAAEPARAARKASKANA